MPSHRSSMPIRIDRLPSHTVHLYCKMHPGIPPTRPVHLNTSHSQSHSRCTLSLEIYTSGTDRYSPGCHPTETVTKQASMPRWRNGVPRTVHAPELLLEQVDASRHHSPQVDALKSKIGDIQMPFQCPMPLLSIISTHRPGSYG